jgi:hypothetical protein
VLLAHCCRWNSWNTFGCQGLSDQVVRGVADEFIALGLHEAGYTFVNMDDCWMLKDRDPKSHAQVSIKTCVGVSLLWFAPS